MTVLKFSTFYYSTKSFTPCASISVLIDFQVVKSSFLKKDFLQIMNVNFYPSNIFLQLLFIQTELLLVAGESRELSVIVDCVFLGAAEEVILQRAVTRPHHGPSITDGQGPVSILRLRSDFSSL